jgi:hypothetical protein
MNMRLSEPQTQRVQEKTGASVVPEDNPSMPALKQNFGDHTFFLDAEGLHIWETVTDEPAEDGKLVGVRIASWSNEDKTSLVPHEPAPSQVLEAPGEEG